MSARPIQEFENTVKYINSIMTLCGNNMLDTKWRQGLKGKILYLIPTITMLSIPICSLNAVLHNYHDFIKLTTTLLSSAACLQVTFKLIVLQFTYKSFRNLIDVFKKFRVRYSKDITEEMCTERSLPKNTIARMYYISVALAAVIMTVCPLFAPQKFFPFDYYLPIGPPHESPYFEVNYVFICIDFALYVSFTTGMDSIFMFLVLEMCLQFDIINKKLSSLKSDGDCFEELGEIQRMYQDLTKSIHAVNETFRNIFLLQSFTSLVLICISLFVTTKTGSYVFAVFVVAFILQLGVYCVFGEILKQKITNFLFDLYNPEWYDMRIKEKKSLIIMMSFAQIDLTLKAGGLIELSLETYFKILKTAYTYCAVMGDINA